MPDGGKRDLWPTRLARLGDVSAIEALIGLSARGLQAAHYTPEQIEAAIGPVFGVDRQLISDGTYYMVEDGGTAVGCGGWGRRASSFGGDAQRIAPDPELDPRVSPARVRAFFVHPRWARRGVGRSLLSVSERAIAQCGFGEAVAVATLSGEPLYASCGYAVERRYALELPGGLTLPVVRMSKALSGPV